MAVMSSSRVVLDWYHSGTGNDSELWADSADGLYTLVVCASTLPPRAGSYDWWIISNEGDGPEVLQASFGTPNSLRQAIHQVMNAYRLMLSQEGSDALLATH